VSCCEGATTPLAACLGNLLQKPHLVALLDAHDTIAGQRSKSHQPAVAALGYINGVASQLLSSRRSSRRSRDRDSVGHKDSVGHRDRDSLGGKANVLFNMPEENGQLVDTVRVVGLRRVPPTEPLGLTVKEDEDGLICIARVLAGGPVERQGLLRVGDAILELNGVPINSLDTLYDQIQQCGEDVTFKILPSSKNIVDTHQCYLRALFDYDPSSDKLLPSCPGQTPAALGLPFSKGDILQVVDQSDVNWWQASVVGCEAPRVGLIPSQELEERRKAFVPHEFDFVYKIGICGSRISKKKKKQMFSSKKSASYDRAELMLYEEVARMPPFERKTLVLVGCRGVGRRTLKARIIGSDPSKFGSIIPHTSRPMRDYEEDGKAYHFVSREVMERDVRAGRYLEWGEHGGHLYGTKLDSMLKVVRDGRMCVLDCAPESLKLLHNSSELLPYIIFLAAPGVDQIQHMYAEQKGFYSSDAKSLTFDRQSSSRYSSRRARTLESLSSLYEEDDFKRTIDDSTRLERTYDNYFDLTIVNNDLNDTYDAIMEAIEALATTAQWVPVTWVY